MPISCPIQFAPLSRDEYRKRDYQVMQHVFACQNELSRAGVVLGVQRCHLLADDVAFRITSHTDHLDRIETQLRRFLALTPLRACQWLNLNHTEATLTTLLK